jgi:predicted secreted Zn-dependent protease
VGRRGCLGLAALVACGRPPLECPAQGNASDVQVIRTIEHYQVPAADLWEYHERQKLPFKCKTDEAIACHEGRFCVYDEMGMQGGSCRVVGLHITYLARITLPHWPTAPTEGDAAEEYRLLQAMILEHEETHHRIGRKYVEELRRAYWGAPPQPTCAALQKVLAAREKAVRDAHDKEQDAFDKEDYKVTFEQYKAKRRLREKKLRPPP